MCTDSPSCEPVLNAGETKMRFLEACAFGMSMRELAKKNGALSNRALRHSKSLVKRRSSHPARLGYGIVRRRDLRPAQCASDHRLRVVPLIVAVKNLCP